VDWSQLTCVLDRLSKVLVTVTFGGIAKVCVSVTAAFSSQQRELDAANSDTSE